MPSFCAAPAAALHTTNPASAARNIRRRPTASPRRPAGTSASPKSARTRDHHWIAAGDAPRLSRIDGRATATMLTSSRLMNPAVSVTERARQRADRVSSGGSTGPVPAARSHRARPIALRSPARSSRSATLPARRSRRRRRGESGLAGSSGPDPFPEVPVSAPQRPDVDPYDGRRRPTWSSRTSPSATAPRPWPARPSACTTSGSRTPRARSSRVLEPRCAVPLPARGRPGDRRLGQGRGEA